MVPGSMRGFKAHTDPYTPDLNTNFPFLIRSVYLHSYAYTLGLMTSVPHKKYSTQDTYQGRQNTTKAGRTHMVIGTLGQVDM